jgi:hypothetical protein
MNCLFGVLDKSFIIFSGRKGPASQWWSRVTSYEVHIFPGIMKPGFFNTTKYEAMEWRLK